MKIKNHAVLASTPLRRIALQLAEQALAAIDTANVMRSSLNFTAGRLTILGRTWDLAHYRHVYAVSVGKCAVEAGLVLEELLGERLTGGIVYSLERSGQFKHLKSLAGTHPFPSEQNVAASNEIVKLLSAATEQDLVICLISGGGSTLLCLPQDMNYQDERLILKTLFEAGADIKEINTVRKHISRARGGFLAAAAYPAEVVSLIFSDVPGNDLQFIASGPTVKDSTTIEEAAAILNRYKVLSLCGLEQCGLLETPKEDKFFKTATNILAVSDVTALEAMAAKAAELGFSVTVKTSFLKDEAQEVGQAIAQEIRNAKPGSCLLYSGETTITAMGTGKGGRNLELALAALPLLAEGELVLALASDGLDNCDFAGAIADKETQEHAVRGGLDPLASAKSHQSYSFFEQSKDQILTGSTGSNVSDLCIALKAPL